MEKRLNLGSGIDYKVGWINVDKLDSVHPNIVHDLNDFPYPFDDDSVDEIQMNDVLEHLSDVEKVISELYRICKDKAIIKLLLPYYKYWGAYKIGHKHLFNEHSFDDYRYGDEWNFQYKEKFNILKIKRISSGKRRFIPLKCILNTFLWEIYWKIEIVLEVVK